MSVDTSAEAVDADAAILETMTAVSDYPGPIRAAAMAKRLRALAAERDALRAEFDQAAGVIEDRNAEVNALAAENARLQGYVEAFRREETRADRLAETAERAEAERDAARVEVERLREALTTLRRAITDEDEHNNCSIIDTVWVSSVETAVDFIDAALAGDPQP